TCDGLLALLDCGLPVTDARVAAAISWLRNHGDDIHPGEWPDDRKDSAFSLAFYFAQGYAEVLHRIHELAPAHHEWSRERMRSLSNSLRARQEENGSWFNEEPESLEDDPILATSLALRAFSRCLEPLR